MIRTLSVCLLGAIALTTAGSCAAKKPVDPLITATPKSPVWLHPDLQPKLLIPDIKQQQYSFTQDGLLTYTFHLQNQSDLEVWVQVMPTFYDESGERPVYEPLGGRREVIPSAGTKPISVVCNNPRGRSVVVQVLPVR